MKKYIVVRAVVKVVALGSVLFAPLALAQPVKLPKSPIQDVHDLPNLFCTSLNWMFWGLMALTVAMVLIGGYRYVTAAGDPEKVRSANKILLFAVIAVAVALIAEGVPFIIATFIGSDYSTAICT